MRSLFFLSIALILSGIALFFVSIAHGEGGFAFFLIFPVIYTTGIIGAMGSLLLFLGIFLLFLHPFISLAQTEDFVEVKDVETKRDVHYGGVVLIGPIPIVFGSDRNTALLALLGAFLLMAGIFLFFFLASL